VALSVTPLAQRLVDYSLSEEDRGRDVAVRLALLQCSASRSAIAHFLAWSTLPAARRALVLLDSVESGTLDDASKRQVERFGDGLRRSVDDLAGLAEGQGSDESPMALYLDERAYEIEQQRNQWRHTIRKLEAERGDGAIEGIAGNIREALDGDSIDRKEAFAEARRGIEAIYGDATHSLPAPLAATLGWLYERGGAFAEAEKAYLAGLLEGVRRRDLAFDLCARHLALLQMRVGRPAASISTLDRALTGRNDADADLWLDLARYAQAAGDAGRLEEAWKNALSLRPASVIELLGDLPALDRRHIDHVLAAQVLARKSASARIQAWTAAREKVREALRVHGPGISLGSLLRTDGGGGFEAASLFEAIAMEAEADARRTELLEAARIRLTERAADAALRLEKSRAALEGYQEKKERALAEVRLVRDREEADARTEMERRFEESRLQSGCMTSLSIGCGGMILYVAATLALSWAKVRLGPETTVGKIILGLIALPLVLGAVLQILAGIKRAALEAEMWKRIEVARQQYDQTAEATASAFSERLPSLRKALEEAEAASSRARAALEVLGA